MRRARGRPCKCLRRRPGAHERAGAYPATNNRHPMGAKSGQAFALAEYHICAVHSQRTARAGTAGGGRPRGPDQVPRPASRASTLEGSFAPNFHGRNAAQDGDKLGCNSRGQAGADEAHRREGCAAKQSERHAAGSRRICPGAFPAAKHMLVERPSFLVDGPFQLATAWPFAS